VPAFLYLAQNNLLFVAVANLEAVIYQVFLFFLFFINLLSVAVAVFEAVIY
jgi:hypothetical protein